MSKSSDHLHYDKNALLAEYHGTFGMFIKALALAVGIVLLFFFVFIYYLGDKGHTRAKPFIDEFGSTIEYDYKGTKLPEFGGPATPDVQHHGAE